MNKKTINTECRQVLVAFLGDQMFGIPIMQIQDVLRARSITTVPLAHSCIEGVMNLRGRIVTAVNLRKRISAISTAVANDGGEDDYGMSIVIEHEGELFSLIVDKVGDVLSLDPEMIEEPPVTLNPLWKEICLGAYQLKQEIMLILNTGIIFKMETMAKKEAS
jgi:purine-binding chemotaxis protein CheW